MVRLLTGWFCYVDVIADLSCDLISELFPEELTTLLTGFCGAYVE